MKKSESEKTIDPSKFYHERGKALYHKSLELVQKEIDKLEQEKNTTSAWAKFRGRPKRLEALKKLQTTIQDLPNIEQYTHKWAGKGGAAQSLIREYKRNNPHEHSERMSYGIDNFCLYYRKIMEEAGAKEVPSSRAEDRFKPK